MALSEKAKKAIAAATKSDFAKSIRGWGLETAVSAPHPTRSEPKPRFKLGEAVNVMNGDHVLFEGEVSFNSGYDAHLGQYRYKVRNFDGSSRLTFNENSLRSKRLTAYKRFKPKTAQEKTIAAKGDCIWQTEHGTPHTRYCERSAHYGHLCAEHATDLEEHAKDSGY